MQKCCASVEELPFRVDKMEDFAVIRIIHIVEVLCVALGLFFIVGAFFNLSVAEAAGLSGSFVRDTHPLLGFAGIALASVPVTRRMALQMFCDDGAVAEFQEMTSAMRRIGLQHRVQATNLYLAGLPDESWRKVFPNDRELYSWLGEAYHDSALRRQMHPDVASRTERAVLSIGTVRV